MDRDTYRQTITQLWRLARQLDALELLHLEIAARRRGTRDELQAVTILRRAMVDFPFPKETKQP